MSSSIACRAASSTAARDSSLAPEHDERFDERRHEAHVVTPIADLARASSSSARTSARPRAKSPASNAISAAMGRKRRDRALAASRSPPQRAPAPCRSRRARRRCRHTWRSAVISRRLLPGTRRRSSTTSSSISATRQSGRGARRQHAPQDLRFQRAGLPPRARGRQPARDRPIAPRASPRQNRIWPREIQTRSQDPPDRPPTRRRESPPRAVGRIAAWLACGSDVEPEIKVGDRGASAAIAELAARLALARSPPTNSVLRAAPTRPVCQRPADMGRRGEVRVVCREGALPARPRRSAAADRSPRSYARLPDAAR